MRLVIQRVDQASVEVDKIIVGEIKKGLLILVGFHHNDNIEKIDYMVKKISNLRIFDDKEGIMNLSIQDIKGSILSVSQFTLYGDTSEGNRPSYINAMKSKKAKDMYELFNKKLKALNLKVEEGIFQADMKVNLINNGPVTIIIEK